MPADRAPSAPSDLDATSKALWTRTIEQLRAQSTWENSDAPLLERYVRALELARLCRKERGGRLTALGYRDQPVQHPLLRAEREATRDANDYAKALLLTPEARKAEAGKKATGGKFGFD